MSVLFEKYKNELIRLNYSQSTIDVYLPYFKKFIEYFPSRDCRKISTQEIIDYLTTLVLNHNISTSAQNQIINSIKFYYEKILHYPRKTYYINRPRREQKLPEILSEEEVAKVIGAIKNLKHKSILMLLYSAGLRLNEVINLKFSNIDRSRMVINIRGAKGKKDRQVPLEPNVLKCLEIYYRKEKIKPINYVFKGQGDKEQYSRKSVQEIVKKYCLNVGITKRISPHKLRHTCGTHLRERGVDLSIIQDMFGHNSPKTTKIYAKLSSKLINKLPRLTEKL